MSLVDQLETEVSVLLAAASLGSRDADRIAKELGLPTSEVEAAFIRLAVVQQQPRNQRK